MQGPAVRKQGNSPLLSRVALRGRAGSAPGKEESPGEIQPKYCS